MFIELKNKKNYYLTEININYILQETFEIAYVYLKNKFGY